MSDSDSEDGRLPSGLRRAGYDADTQTYTYRDRRTGEYYEGQPGSRYGNLTRVGAPAYTLMEEDPNAPRKSWRQENQPLLSFFLLIALFLIGLFWLLGYADGGPAGVPKMDCAPGQGRYVVVAGDTCWKIADDAGATVGDLRKLNEKLDCDALPLGRVVCLPGGGAD